MPNSTSTKPIALDGRCVKRGLLINSMDRGNHPIRLKQLGWHKRCGVLIRSHEFGELFEGHPLDTILKASHALGLTITLRSLQAKPA